MQFGDKTVKGRSQVNNNPWQAQTSIKKANIERLLLERDGERTENYFKIKQIALKFVSNNRGIGGGKHTKIISLNNLWKPISVK